jgi:Lon protease-like protein
MVGVGIAAGFLLVFVAALLLLGDGGGGRAAIEVSGQPRLRVDRELIDLGDVRLGQAVEVAFVLTNVGDQPLRVTDAPYAEVVEGC